MFISKIYQTLKEDCCSYFVFDPFKTIIMPNLFFYKTAFIKKS